MTNLSIQDQFSSLSTPLISDACLRLNIPFDSAPPGIHPIIAGTKIAGRALPAKHYGSVDVFIEATLHANSGDILVIDNQCRTDEACIGDLTALEVKASGLSGIVIWGCHRDTPDLIRIKFPVFSYGTCPKGPQRLDEQESDALVSAKVGPTEVKRGDFVFADDDGVLFVTTSTIEKLLETAQTIFQTERRQAESIQNGRRLREQLKFLDYLAGRAKDPSYTFRKHLRSIGGAIEE